MKDKKRGQKESRNSFLYSLTQILLITFLIGSLFYLFPEKEEMITGMTAEGNFSVTITALASCNLGTDATTVSFGDNITATGVYNATQNYNGTGSGSRYNISTPNTNNVNINITVSGTNLVSGSNTIGVSNITWKSSFTANDTGMNYSSSYSLTTSQSTQKVASDMNPNNVTYIRFWLNVPSIMGGTFTGNYTITCSQS